MAARGDAAAQLPSDIGGFGARKTGSRAIDYQPDGDLSFPLRLQPGFARQPLGLEPLAIVGKCLLRDLVLSHCLFGINLAKCLARIALRFGARLGWFKLARCLCHFFAFRPSSTRRRMASERVTSCFLAQASSAFRAAIL